MLIRLRLLAAVLLFLSCPCFLPMPVPAAADAAEGEGLTNPFFALSNCLVDDKHPTPESQAQTLAELGYAGIAPSGVSGIPEMLKGLDANGLKMFALYVGANLDPDQPKYDPGLPAAIKLLKGRDTFIWLFIRSSKYKPSSSEGDPRAVEIVGEIAKMAEQSGLRVALYPHTGFYVERVEDAVRVAEKVDRRNVGVTFNLCHWLKVGDQKNMKPLIKSALPHLFLVTINGADPEGKSDRTWSRLIQPLDSGSFDLYGLLKALKDLGYAGPVGLQCYGVPGDKYENLKRSMAAWRRLSARMAAESN